MHRQGVLPVTIETIGDATLYLGDCRTKLAELAAQIHASEAELAYCAGVIDSDGTIGIKRSTYAMRVLGEASQPVFSERVCVKQVEIAAVSLLHTLFGGRFGMDDPSAKRGKPLYVWQVTDKKAATALYLMLPYLRIKQAQAKNCLQLREIKEHSKRTRVAHGRGHVGAATRSVEITAAMEGCYSQAKSLNRVGIADFGASA